MSEYILNPEWKLKTNNGEPNFNMAVARYFVPISDAHKVNTENRELYINDYNNNICPFVKQNLAIKDYDENTIKELIDVIQENRKLSSVTMESRINHLVLDIVQIFVKYNINITQINSKMMSTELQEQAVFIDFDGHKEDTVIQNLLNDLAPIVQAVRIIGSYTSF